MTTYNEALLKAIEGDLPDYHHKRMAQRQAEQSLALAAERAKSNPDVKRIEQLLAEMVQTERDKRDLSITEREVLQPLRDMIAAEKEAQST
ncbi:MAG: hypothetical protein JSS25_05325 [Proteobacteria bacterium]|nr:hypothetical protein [Pseudomonadota bacterium]